MNDRQLPNGIVETRLWAVELHWHPHVPRDARPVPASFVDALLDQGEARPGLYVPRQWLFSSPPTRAEFAAALKAAPWSAHAYRPVIDMLEQNRCMWPTPSSYEKAGSEDLFDGDRRVGRIDVRATRYFLNAGHARPDVTRGDVRHALGPHAKSDLARVEQRWNELKERLAALPNRPNPEELRGEIRRLLEGRPAPEHPDNVAPARGTAETTIMSNKTFAYVIRAKPAEVAPLARAVRENRDKIKADFDAATNGTPLEIADVVERPRSVVVSVLSDDFRPNVLTDVLRNALRDTGLDPSLPTWG